MSRTAVPGSATSASISPLDSASAICIATLAMRPAALITDIDGTISPIVARPEDATLYPGIAGSLKRLEGCLDVVAVVTGRDEGTARRMVGVDRLTYVANYGGRGSASPSALLAALQTTLAGLPCVQVEPKDTGFSLHYRNCDDPDGVRTTILEAATPVVAGAGAKLVEGKRVVEVLPLDQPDKAAAVRGLIERRGLRGVVYLGDDISDVAVFEELALHRRRGGFSAACIAVADTESHPSLLANADAVLGSVGEVAALLSRLATELGERKRVKDD